MMPNADFARGYRFQDLVERRIVSSRSNLHDLQRDHDFPLPVKIGTKAWWPVDEIHSWLRRQAAKRTSSPTTEPIDEAEEAGRPPG